MTLLHLLCNGTETGSEESDKTYCQGLTAEPSHLSTLNPTEAVKIVPETSEGQICNEELLYRDHGAQFDFIYTVWRRLPMHLIDMTQTSAAALTPVVFNLCSETLISGTEC